MSRCTCESPADRLRAMSSEAGPTVPCCGSSGRGNAPCSRENLTGRLCLSQALLIKLLIFTMTYSPDRGGWANSARIDVI